MLDYAVLGRAGFLRAFTLCWSPRHLTIARARPWWSRLLLRLTREHPRDQPL